MPASMSLYLNLVLPLIVLAGALPWASRYRTALRCNYAALMLALAIPVMCISGVVEGLGLTAVWQPVPAFAQAIAVLVTFLGTVLIRFSQNYLAGEHSQDEYVANMQLTLGAVLLVVLSNHLAVVIVGWIAISLGLHKLLMFYPNRPRAVLAAHKKFLLARLAETILLAAGGLLYVEYGTWQLDSLRKAMVATTPGLAAQWAALLIAVVALIKCAQLPVHGWLIQVVEAPTPVSALLHAGVINMGGVLLMIFAPLISQVPMAQWLLLVVAGLTTVVAALVMTVEVSVKARLAWSTSAQMGLMLVECALGLYQLALLHLIAHSCYKAYVFLSAGAAVHRASFVAPKSARTGSVVTTLASLAVAGLVTAGAAMLFAEPVGLSPWLLLTALLTLLFMETAARGGSKGFAAAGALALVFVTAFSLQKWVAGQMIDATSAGLLSGADLWISALIVLLSALFWLISEAGDSAVARHLRALLFAGFYLDEGFTRLTLKLWPVTLPHDPRKTSLTPAHNASTSNARESY